MDQAILQALEGIRNQFLDIVFAAWTMLGEEIFITAIIAVVFFCINKSLGEKMLVTILSASAFCTGLKSAIRRTRPYAAGVVDKVDVDTPFVSTNDLDIDMSCPSGHSCASASFFGNLALTFRRPGVIVFSIIAVLGVMFSRLYLGVHYPTDVLSGFAIGVLFAIIWQTVYAGFYKKRLWVFFAFALLTLPLLFIARTMTESMFKISAITLAAAIGLLIEEKFFCFADANKWWKRILRLAIAIIAAAVPFLLLYRFLPDGNWSTFAQYFAAIFFALTVTPLLIVKLRL